MDIQLISIDAAAKALGLGRSSIYNLIGQGSLTTVHVGRRRLVAVASVAALVGKAS